MKLHYIGVRREPPARLPDRIPTDASWQIIRTDEPVHELCAEKELSAYSRFTKNKYDGVRPTRM